MNWIKPCDFTSIRINKAKENSHIEVPSVHLHLFWVTNHYTFSLTLGLLDIFDWLIMTLSRLVRRLLNVCQNGDVMY